MYGRTDYNFRNDVTYVEPFFVGLFDGDGSCQENHWRRQCLQFRLVIKLSNLIDNQLMLEHIQSFIGGKVRMSSDKTFVLWIADDKTTIRNILHIFNRYPLLTSRVILQLRFMRHCFNHNNIHEYFNEREFKFNNRLNVINSLSNVDLITLPYYSSWLSSFIEAESSFSAGNDPHTDVYLFSIGQNNNKYLIESIKYYFKATNDIRNPYKDFY